MPALELALESKFRESGDSPMSFELSWRPGGSIGFLINLFGFFKLTMVVVRGREGFFLLNSAAAELIVANAASAVQSCNKGLVEACSKLRVESVRKAWDGVSMSTNSVASVAELEVIKQ